MERIIFSLKAGLLMVAYTTSPEELILQAALSAEYHEGRFTPEAGDWIYEARKSNNKAQLDWALVKN
ncbi:MAG: hypothetical protein WD361_13960 [Gracilimonas sp.]